MEREAAAAGDIDEMMRLAEAGDFSALDGWSPCGPSPHEAAVAVRVQMARWLHGRGGATPPAPTALEAFLDGQPEVRHHAAATCAQGALGAVLSFDARALASWCALQDRLGGDPVAAEATRLWLEIVRRAPRKAVDERTRRLAREAVSRSLPTLAIVGTVLLAMAALSEGDVEAALVAARRASRMARTEGLREAELLANLVLARVRRQTGKPHLAARILATVARLAPPVWHGWIAWERLLAAGLDAPGVPPSTEMPSAVAARALADLLAAAASGDADAARSAAARIRSTVAEWPDAAEDAALAIAAVDPSVPPPPSLHDWATGRAAEVPRGLHGLSPVAPEQAVAFVVAGPGVPGRRILVAGLPLVAASAGSPDELAGSPREHYRTDTALALLALAGEAGVALSELFERVYRIEFVPGLHKNAFNVLLHRARKRVGALAELVRTEQRTFLRPHRPLVLPDPRCVEPMEVCVMRLLAARNASSSEELATELRLSVRTVQAALKQLLADGACHPERHGRRVIYRVDDTTFCEPTPPDAAPP